MKKGIAFFVVILLAASLMAVGQKEGEFKYPTKTIEILMGVAPGTDTDLSARLYARYLEKRWGVPVVITNLPNQVPTFFRIQSGTPADGYTLATTHDALVINMANKTLDFGLDDLSIVGMHTMVDGQILTVRADSPWQTLEDFARATKARPDTYTLAVQIVSVTAIMGRQLQADGLDVRLVDSSGGADRIQKLLGCHVDAALLSWTSSMDYEKSGQFRMLAICNPQRSQYATHIPTARELGYNSSWPTRHLFFMPKGVDPRIIAEWDKACSEIAKDPEFQKDFFNIGAFPEWFNSEETGKILREEIMPNIEAVFGR